MRGGIIPAPIMNLPWRLLLPVMFIAGFGCVVLYSAAGGHVRPWAFSQGLRFVVFLGLALFLGRIKQDSWKAIAFPAYGIICVLLLIVELFGAVKGGSQRWIDLGFIRLQPSELMKIAIVLAISRFYDIMPAGEIRRWNAIWIPLVMILLPAGLVLLQPDLGTATMIIAGGITVMFLAGLPLRLFIGGGVAVLAALPILWFSMHDYQRNRVLIFLDPESDPLGTGYHISQSKIAIGSGGFFGKGFLNGSQSHLDYLPEGHTDFVFATMAEEWGLVGATLLIAAYFMIVRYAMQVANRSQDKFGRLLASGLGCTIFYYFSVNIMMVMGMAPVVGIPLPMFSFGGSALMTLMICFGMLMSIDRASRRSGQFI